MSTDERPPGEWHDVDTVKPGSGKLSEPRPAQPARNGLARVAKTRRPEQPAVDDNSGSPFPHSWRPVDLGPVVDGTWTPLQASVGERLDGQHVLYAGRVHTVASESEAGKTWLALSLCRDELDRGRHAVFIDFEDDEGGVAGRLLALGTRRELVTAQFHYLRPVEPLGTGINLDDLRHVLDSHQPTLVVVDGVTAGMSVHALDPVNNRDVAEFNRVLLARLAAAGPAVLVLDHVPKSTENRGRYAIGAVHKLNGVTGASFILEALAPARVGGIGRSRLRIAKDRPGQLRSHAVPSLRDDGMDWFADLVIRSHAPEFVELELNAPDTTGTVVHDRIRPTVYMARVSRVLADLEPVQLTQRAILDRVKGNDKTVRSAIAALVDEGYVAAEPGPRGSTLHQHLRPFTDDDQT